jgi:hypothetical protein
MILLILSSIFACSLVAPAIIDSVEFLTTQKGCEAAGLGWIMGCKGEQAAVEEDEGGLERWQSFTSFL